MEDLVGCPDRNIVLEKEMRSGVGGAKDELDDLHGRHGSLDGIRDLDTECCEEVVGVLVLLVRDDMMCVVLLPSRCGCPS